MPGISIRDIVIFGDSLSGRGRMANRKLFGFLSMENLSGLEGKSYYGRFANFHVWTDLFSKLFAKESGFLNPDLENPLRVKTSFGETIVRTFCEGGCTSADYSMKFNTLNINHLAAREILTNLDELREELVENDKAIEISKEDKEETLVLEWTGVNDLITVNTAPSKELADIAIQERISHVEEMIKLGYKNFVLLNLPDIGKTPRFKNLSKTDQEKASSVVKYFNEALKAALDVIKVKQPKSNVELYDISHEFDLVYAEPIKNGFDEKKLGIPFTESSDFKEGERNDDATGYMFWDDVHPSSEMHQIFAAKLFAKLKETYKFHAPREPLMKIFKEAYGNKVQKINDGSVCCCLPGYGCTTEIKKKDVANLKEVFDLALKTKDKIIRQTLIELDWIDDKDQVISKNHDLVEAAKEYMHESDFMERTELRKNLKEKQKKLAA